MKIMESEADLHTALDSHPGESVLVFKHSTQCPISAAALRQVQQFETSAATPVFMIRVIEERPLSNRFAEDFHVTHQSPQAIVIKNGQVEWHASHYDITEASLKQAVQP